jgi:hypothetical protein
MKRPSSVWPSFYSRFPQGRGPLFSKVGGQCVPLIKFQKKRGARRNLGNEIQNSKLRACWPAAVSEWAMAHNS